MRQLLVKQLLVRQFLILKRGFPKPLVADGPVGFSLMEVLASITLMGLLMSVALQAMVSAVALKVSSNKISQSRSWIQSDLEAVRFVASTLPVEPNRCRNATRGYALALRDALGSSSPSTTFTSDGGVYTLQRNLSVGSDPSILVVQYAVVPASGPAIDSLRAEVIPHAAFNCF